MGLTCSEDAVKVAEADAKKARSALREERLDWEKADADARGALTSLRREWRMLQDTNAQLHATVKRLTKSLEVPPLHPRPHLPSLARFALAVSTGCL